MRKRIKEWQIKGEQIENPRIKGVTKNKSRNEMRKDDDALESKKEWRGKKR